MKIHPVFHVSLLEPISTDTIPGRKQIPPPPIILNNEIEYEVQKILDSRIKYKKLEYLVDWKGYDTSHRTWEPAINLSNTNQLVKDFHFMYPDKPRPHGARSERGDLLS